MARRLAAGGLAFASLLACLCAPAAEAQKRPVYRDPPKYRGISKAPPTAPEQQPPQPPSGVLSETGQNPDVLVDEAGTAHVVWNESRGDLDDAAFYCRVKRGAAACEHAKELLWQKDYGTGDGPQYNTDYLGPKIVRIGGLLAVVSKRYPTIGQKPDGGSSSTVVIWTSSDGGSTWSENAEIVGKWNPDQLAVIGPGDDPTVLAVGIDPLCQASGPSAWCITAFRSGQYAADAGNLGTTPNQNYYAGVALDETGRPISIATDAGGTGFARRWSGVGSVIDPSTWGPANPFPADGPAISGGPAGVWMISKTTFNSGPFSVQRLNVGGDNSVTPGPEAVVSRNIGDQFANIHQDPSGRLHAGWVQRGGEDPGVRLRSSTPTGFGPELRLGADQANGKPAIGATDDGGGFAAFDRNEGSTGGIVLAGFGNQAATGRPGLGGLAGGEGPVTNVSCKKVDFGRFAVETVQGCFLNGTGANSRVVVTGGEINLHGLRIIPDPGARIVIDPRKLTIDTIGNVRVLVSNGQTEFLLWHGAIKRDLSRLVPGSNLFEFPVSKFKAKLLGFPVESDIPVKLQADGVHIPIALELPKAFGGFAGNAEVIATRDRGLVLDSLHIHIGPVMLGALTIETLDIDYRAGNFWSGTGTISMPQGGKINVLVEFEAGDFKRAGFDYTLAPPATIGPFVYLLSIGGEFALRPVKIEARASIGAGAAFRGEAPVKVNGRFTMTFPPSGPADFTLRGTVDMFMFRVGEGYLKFQTDGYAAFGGHTGLEIGPASLDVDLDGFIDAPTGQFGASIKGEVKVCLVFPFPTGDIPVCGSAEAASAINNNGFAACARVNPPDPFGPLIGGIAFDWEEIDPLALYNPVLLLKEAAEIITIPCYTTRYRTPPPRAAQAGGQAFAVPRGLPSATFLVKGQGGRPSVTVTGPGGARVASGVPSRAGVVTAVAGVDAAYVVLNRPAGGTWTVAANEGSVPIAQVMLSNGYRPASVRAKVRRGRIAYRIANGGGGQRVTFVEKGRFGTHLLGTVSKRRGTLRFRPATGAGGRRTVIARVEREGGIVTHERTVGRYVAPPPPRPGAVRRLRARKRGSVVTVTFRPARGAHRTQVVVRGAQGARLAKLVGRRTRKVRFPGLRWERRFTVTARALSKAGRPGPLRRAKLRARV